MNTEPFHIRVRKELDEIERCQMKIAMLMALAGGLFTASVLLAAWVIL